MASSARIDELRKKFDENPRRYFAPLANEYRKAGDLEQAIFICQEYLPQQPGHMSGHIVYGQALFEQARFDEARAVFETALSLDPENLIALRHLGDIARQSGDLRGARAWYQRVLEADPRNEEIAQIMLTVLTTPHESQPAVASGGTPLGTDVVPGIEQGFESTAIAGSEIAGFPVEQSEDNSGLAVGPELSQLAERQAEPEPDTTRRSSETIPEDELLDLNDFSVGDIPLSSLVSAPAEQPASQPFVETGPAFESAAAAADAETIEIERSGDEAPFEADPYAIASAPAAEIAEAEEPPPLPPEAFATDIVLGLPDDGTTPSLSDTHDASALDGLQSFSEPSYTVDAEAASPLAMDVESFFDAPESPLSTQEFDTSFTDAVESSAAEPFVEALPVESSHVESHAFESANIESAWTPADEAPAAAEEEFVPASEAFVAEVFVPESEAFVAEAFVPVIEETLDAPQPTAEVLFSEAEAEAGPEAFVTETMAELYLQQGHLEDALDIYQKLLEQRPGDERLRERMLAVADAIQEIAESGGVEEAAVVAGPTIREFLSGLLQPRAYMADGDIAVRAPTPGSTATIDAPSFDEPVFDTSGYSDAPSFGESASYETPAYEPPTYEAPTYEAPTYEAPTYEAAAFESPDFDAPTYEADETPTYELSAHEASSFDLPSFGAESIDPPFADSDAGSPASDGPTFEESPYDATTLEIDLTSAEYRSLGSPEASVDSVGSIDEEFGSEQMPEPVEAPAAAAGRPTPSSLETITGSIDALFSGADASTTDATAASTLAQAFASELPETPPLQGMPAHRAADELSLDHVFKSNPAPRPEAEGEGFSFDQFFAEDMTETAPKSGTDPMSPAAQGGTDDIAQFNNWLNGLKKT